MSCRKRRAERRIGRRCCNTTWNECTLRRGHKRFREDTNMTTQNIIKDFIVDSLLVASDRSDIGADEPLTSSGLIDSLGMLRLIMFLEEHFNVHIGDGEVGEENFGTVSRLAAFVDRKSQTS